MIRPKAGKRQPRYFKYKRESEKRLILLLQKNKTKDKNNIHSCIQRLRRSQLLNDELIEKSKDILKEIYILRS